MTCSRHRPASAPSPQPTSWCAPGRLYKYDEMAAPEEGECGGDGAGAEGRAWGTPEAIWVRVSTARQVFASGRARPGGVTAESQPRVLGRGRAAPAPLGPQVGVGAPPAPRGSASGRWQPLPLGPAGGRAAPERTPSSSRHRTGLGRLGCGGEAARFVGRVGECGRAGHCAPRVCIDRGQGGGGTLLFARLFPNMAPLLRTEEKTSSGSIKINCYWSPK